MNPNFFARKPLISQISAKKKAIMHFTNKADCDPSVGVASDIPEAAGAPVEEIKITPEMIEAGENIIWRALGGCDLLPSVHPDELAKEVFEAMVEVSRNRYVV
jgi:hypothetical protein